MFNNIISPISVKVENPQLLKIRLRC